MKIADDISGLTKDLKNYKKKLRRKEEKLEEKRRQKEERQKLRELKKEEIKTNKTITKRPYKHKKYTNETPALAAVYASQGLSNDQIAEKLNISQRQFYRNINDHAQFRTVIEKNKEKKSEEVGHAVYRAALGYEVTETVEEVKYVRGVEVSKTVRKSLRHIPPSTAAYQFWLTNKKKEEWQYNYNVNSKSMHLDIKADLSDKSIADRIGSLKKALNHKLT